MRKAFTLLLSVTLAHTLPSGPSCYTTPSTADKALASARRHTGRVAGDTPLRVADAINRHVRQSSEVLPCSQFSHEELNQLVRTLWCSTSPELNQMFVGAKDQRALASLEVFEKRWKSEGELVRSDPKAAQLLRDAKCADVLRLWSHHVPKQSQESLKYIVRLPEMPVYEKEAATHPQVGDTYTESFNCVTGHNFTSSTTNDHKLPHWPEEVHYTATGHGAYPFWLGGGGGGGTAHLEVWWSELHVAEKFYHGSCSMTEAGYSSDVPCYHLMLGKQPNPTAYLYTHTEDFCCISSPDGSQRFATEKLTPIAGDFMDKMTLNVSYGNISGTYYNGPVKQYLMTEPFSEPVTYFWYLTTMDDLPVQQGEGGFGGKGILIYHEYNISSWGKPTIPFTAETFAIPEVCKTTTNKCGFP